MPGHSTEVTQLRSTNLLQNVCTAQRACTTAPERIIQLLYQRVMQDQEDDLAGAEWWVQVSLGSQAHISLPSMAHTP